MASITIGEGIQRVQSLYSAGVQSDNVRLTSRHIYSVLLSSRAIMLKQQSNARSKISQWCYQTLPCIRLEEASITECTCLDPKMRVLRSAYKLPRIITDKREHGFKYVSTLDGLTRFDENDFENVKYQAGNKYTASKPSYYLKNAGYLYVTNRKILQVVTTEGLFYDPIEVFMFPTACDDDNECPDCRECVDVLSIELALDGDMLKGMTDIINSELISLLKQIEEDKSNNATDDTGTQGKMIHR